MSETEAQQMHQPVATLSSLPLELVFLIADELPLVSLIAFSLTSKPTLNTFYTGSKFPALPKGEKAELLSCLERDSPDRFFCFGCTRLCSYKPHHRLGWRGQRHQDCAIELERTETWTGEIAGCRLPRRFCRRGFRDLRGPRTVTQTVKTPVPPWQPETKGPTVWFSEARLVMNRHFYGEPYGLATQSLQMEILFERYVRCDIQSHVTNISLERSCSSREYLTRHRREALEAQRRPQEKTSSTSPLTHLTGQLHRTESVGSRLGPDHSVERSIESFKPWIFTHSRSARIIDDELFLRHFHRIVTDSPTPRGELSGVIDSVGLPICLHLACHSDTFVPRMSVWNARQYIPQLRYFRCGMAYPDIVGSCAFCFTDYTIFIVPHGGEEAGAKTRWTFELTTYHRLGSCRAPDDPVWRNLTTVGAHGTRYSKFRTSGAYGPGEVRRRWHPEGNGETFDYSRWASTSAFYYGRAQEPEFEREWGAYDSPYWNTPLSNSLYWDTSSSNLY